MGIRRIKFIWGSREVIMGRWWLGLFCRYTSRPGFPGSGLAISVRGLLLWSVLFLALGYAGTVWLVTRSLRGAPASEVRWVDSAAWPLRRAQIRRLRGRAWILQGREALAAGRYAEGIFLLRRGLAGDPGDFETRLALAQLVASVGNRSQALAFLNEAPAHGLPNREWCQTVFSLATDGEDWSFMIGLADRLEPLAGSAAPELRAELVVGKARALTGLERGAEAAALLRKSGTPFEAEKVQLVRTLLAINRANEAIGFLAEWWRTVPNHARPLVLRLQAQAFRQAGRFDEFEHALTDLRALNPASPQPAAFNVVEHVKAGRGASEALEDYLLRFGSAPENLRFVAEPLAEIPDVALLRRIIEVAKEHGFHTRPLQAQLARAFLRTGDAPGLARLLSQVEPEYATADGAARAFFNWMQIVSHSLSSPEAGAQVVLVNYLDERPLSLVGCEEAIMALLRAGRLETAELALKAIRRRYPGSPWVEKELAEVARERAALAAAKPVPAAAPRAAALDVNEFFGGLDRAIAAGHWQDARDQVDRLRALQPPPTWLAPRDTDLLRRELRISRALGDAPALRLSATLLLQRGPEHIEELLAFARESDNQGDRASGLLVVKLVQNAYPLNVPARALLDAWEPKRSETLK